MPRRLFPVLLFTLSLLLANSAQAIMMLPPAVPTERLIRNIEAFIEENPKDPQGYYMLARVHYIGFAQQSSKILANEEGSAEKLPNIADPRAMGHRPEGKEKLDRPALIAHARDAIANFQKAIEMDPDNALYHLGYAGILEQSREHAEWIGKLDKLEPLTDEDEDAEGDLPDLNQVYLEKALAENLRAYELDRANALAENDVFLPFYPVAYEAGKAYLRLIEDNESLKAKDEDLLGQISADLQAIDDKPKAITPIVFRIEGESPASVTDLLAEKTIVNFDLDADGVAERRPWVNPDTAILVWDPENTGKITSGQQLFGNMTFFMLFADGYRALDSLDDNRDGKLAADELKGLALWHDRNSNGISDEGEVTPITQTPIQSISTQQRSKEGIHPMNPTGLHFEDGTTRPTWDWIAPAAPGN